ncbi:MAG: bifunctional adenosylcobinamide kinase/adenosylcobinamide-phosphate guanylyltransferase [Faecalibacterium sp.]
MLILVVGGAASGKSEYAESLVLRGPLPRFYVATMQIWDAECAARVQRHRAMRAQKHFETLECPLALEQLRLPYPGGTVLLEDLGNLVANELYSPAGAGKNAAETVLRGVERLAARCGQLVIVGNEVFSGGAEYAGDTERYLQALAQCQNALAAQADAVFRVVCGVPVYYKGGRAL